MNEHPQTGKVTPQQAELILREQIINRQNSEQVKCCMCGEVMSKELCGPGQYDYKCRNNKCETFESGAVYD